MALAVILLTGSSKLQPISSDFRQTTTACSVQPSDISILTVSPTSTGISTAARKPDREMSSNAAEQMPSVEKTEILCAQ